MCANYIKKPSLRLLLVIVVIMWVDALSAVPTQAPTLNHLHGITHNATATSDKQNLPHHIEMGNLVLSFSQDPLVNLLSRGSLGTDNQQVELFFPMADIKARSIPCIACNHEKDGVLYNVQLIMVDKPIRGVKCTITYNQRKITLTYNTIVADHTNGGFIIRFYNKDILQAIKRESAILRTAQRASKKRIA